MRRVLLVLLGVLACVAITLSATLLWVHQVALNTDRYVAVVSRVATDPEVVEEVSGRLADQVVAQFDVPRLVKPLIRNWVQEQLAEFMGTDRFRDAWAAANRAAHTALVAVLRREAVLDPSDGQITIRVLPVILVGLQRLQEVGVLPDDLELPDPSDEEAVDAIRDALAERLGIELAPDFGEIRLVRYARLEAVRQWVTIFDWITVVGLLIAIGLVSLTVWLARDRLRAAILLGLGAVAAVLVAQAATAGIGGAVASALGEDGSRRTVIALVDALLGNLALALTVVLLIGAVVAVAAFVVRRRTLASLAPVPVEASAAMAPSTAPAAVTEQTETVAAAMTPTARKPPATKPPARKPPVKKPPAKPPPARKPPAKKPPAKPPPARKPPARKPPARKPPAEGA